MFYPGRGALVMHNGEAVGVIGTLHPEVLQSFEVPFVASVFEVHMESFLKAL